jgi:hypothetical protein
MSCARHTHARTHAHTHIRTHTFTFKVKVALSDKRSTLSIRGYLWCPFYNFFINQWILKLLGTNVDNNKTMCHAQHPDHYLWCQGQSLTWSFIGYILCPVQTFFIAKWFRNYLTQMFTIMGPCVIHNSQPPTCNVKGTLRYKSLTCIVCSRSG